MKVIRAVFDAHNRRDLDALSPLYSDDVVVDMSESIGPERVEIRGRVAAEAWWREGWEWWESWTWEIEGATDVAPGEVVTATHVRGRGRGSGIDVDARIGQLWRVEGGLVTYVKMFQSEAEALGAARREP
jgi:ketosteroid isomerase-like protein